MEKLNNSLIPTPLHKLEAISKYLEVNIYCKRDDLTGFAFGGNKTRKLDYLIAEAKEKSYNTIVTTGGFQSNFCRITAAYAVKEGLEAYFVLGGKKRPNKLTANLLLMKMFGAKLSFIETEDWDLWESEAMKLADRLTQRGKKVYRMPIGGSNSTGILGYIDCFNEIVSYEKKNNIYFDFIIHASGSAGTQSGLLIGKAVNNWNGKIIGISVAKSAKQLINEVLKLSHEGGKKYNVKVNYKDVIVDDKYIGKGYGVPTQKASEAIKIFAKLEGILLDSVYSAKAAAALIDYCRKKQFKKKQNILFIHTGGNIYLFK
ncbi:MAG: D-cysteine desulfhydrase family protein [Ignavibacteria bacterium]|nr:D-cysteine desulfhydrase family protein [Ignavibacteria bacterium]